MALNRPNRLIFWHQPYLRRNYRYSVRSLLPIDDEHRPIYQRHDIKTDRLLRQNDPAALFTVFGQLFENQNGSRLRSGRTSFLYAPLALGNQHTGLRGEVSTAG